MGNIEFLKAKFREYYLKNDIHLPPRFNRREYGFMFFDKNYVLRHTSFLTKKEIKRFLVENVPKHAYYSAAYYKDPKNKDMEKKGWLGSDLIFDLDADHVPGAENLRYEEMLKVIKKEAEKLIFKYLLDDFGFDENSLFISFSGGRGYHIHVRSDDVYSLSSDERREIVTYIMGEGANFLKFFNIVEERRGKKRRKKYLLYPEDYGGWYSKISREITRISRDLLSLYNNEGEDKVIEELNSVIENKKLAKKVVRDLFKENKDRKRKIDILSSSHQFKKLQTFESDEIRDLFLLYIKEKIRIRGETDEPVTTDIHRLIRLTYSLHGKTGFMVKPLSLKEFKYFNPLKDAIPQIFKINQSKIITKNRISIKLNDENYEIDGEECVPDYVAIFLIARGLADFIAGC